MNAEYLAKEAERLKRDDVLNFALDEVRREALDELCAADADNKTMILRCQQRVAVVDEIRSMLDRYIMRMAGRGNGTP